MRRAQREHCIAGHHSSGSTSDAQAADDASSTSSILGFEPPALASPGSRRPSKTTASSSATFRCTSLGAPSALTASSCTAASVIDLRSNSRVSVATDLQSRRGPCSAGATPAAQDAVAPSDAADGLRDVVLVSNDGDHRHDAFTAMWVSKHSSLVSATTHRQARCLPPPPQSTAPAERRPVRRTLSALTRELRSHEAQYECAQPVAQRLCSAPTNGVGHPAAAAADASPPGWVACEAVRCDPEASLRHAEVEFAEGVPPPHTAPEALDAPPRAWQRGPDAPVRRNSVREDAAVEMPVVLARPAFPVLATLPSDALTLAPGLKLSAPAACESAARTQAATPPSPPALAPIFQQMRAGPAVGLIFEELTVRTTPPRDGGDKRSIDHQSPRRGGGPPPSERSPSVGVRRASSMHPVAVTEPLASESGERARCLSDQPLADLSPFTSQNSSPVSGLLRPLVAAPEAHDAPSMPFDLSDAEQTDDTSTPPRALAKSASAGAAHMPFPRTPAARERSPSSRVRRGKPPLSPPLSEWRQLAAQAAASATGFPSDDLEEFGLASVGADLAPAAADTRMQVSAASTPRARAAPLSPSCKSAPLLPVALNSSRPGKRPSPIALVLAAQSLLRGGETDSGSDTSECSAGSAEPALALSRAPLSGSLESTPKANASAAVPPSPFDVADGAFSPGRSADGQLHALFKSCSALAQLKVAGASSSSSALASPLASTPQRVSSLTLALKAYSTESTVLAGWDPTPGSGQHVAEGPGGDEAPQPAGGVAQHVSCPVTPITQSRRGSRASLVHQTFLVTVDTGDLDSGLV